jgi:hypothetical protein
MAGGPLDEWRQTLAEDRERVGMLPEGPVRNVLTKKLREMDLLLRAVNLSPEDDPFRARVEAVARRMKETPSGKTTEWDAVLSEFAACVRIARSKMRLKAPQ